ncbi:hypothetical protein CWE29_00640 [Enterococcus faecium]|nr:hypothetical protein CWE29_00640 [Enterococcus faecium]
MFGCSYDLMQDSFFTTSDFLFFFICSKIITVINDTTYTDKNNGTCKIKRECKIFCVNEKIHTKKEVASVE